MGPSSEGEAPVAAEGSRADGGADDGWETLPSTAVRFSGRTAEFYQIWLVNLAFTVASCGLYAPWARLRSRCYFLGQTQLQGSGFDFRANPRALLFGWILIGIGFTLINNFSDFTASAIGFAVAPKFWRQWLVIVLSIGLGLTLQSLIFSWLLLQSLRYNASRTLYRNLRFGFGSQAEHGALFRELLLQLVLGVLLIPTLAGLWPYLAWRWRRFLIRHRRFGTTPFRFSATAADYFRLHLRALPLLLLALAAPLLAIILLAIVNQPRWAGPLVPLVLLLIGAALALGLFWSCWLEAAAARLTWRHTRLGALRFRCTWRAKELLALRLSNGLALLFSLGLAWPWVRIRTYRYRLERILITPAEALGDFLAAEEERISGLAEGAFTMDDPLAGVIDISL
jgi:uncharacterized membrane protein YjgN (DUF898 family)